MKRFLSDFEIDITPYYKNANAELIDRRVPANFVFFLLENKQFICLYEKDYYSNKSLDIIAHLSSNTKEEIENYLIESNFKIDPDYPFRYVSSFGIDYKLNKDSGKYDFLNYHHDHRYEGNYEYRRADYSN
ncbi:hypothetical protein [Dokdonia donghaensis]|uniref:Uncharacterized protein n=1 Tax=Dokdonia donghaensis DSW-1 TaxID=1300343 RepID=A0A0A2GTT2_9FLAO|nr:hypothetical protein [Dokdonia donghaensis]KGO05888.1 hypothetical protein NV36_02850 [Dokdonia donghaensis DSW-1]